MGLEFFLVFLGIVIFLISFLGIILPFLPGVPLAWFGLFLYAYFTDFLTVSLSTVLIFLGLTALTLVLDVFGPLLGARRRKATRYGVLGVVLGIVCGVVVLGPVGFLIGPLLGAFLGELFAGRESRDALRTSIGAALGILASSIVKFLVLLAMLIVFLLALWI